MIFLAGFPRNLRHNQTASSPAPLSFLEMSNRPAVRREVTALSGSVVGGIDDYDAAVNLTDSQM